MTKDYAARLRSASPLDTQGESCSRLAVSWRCHLATVAIWWSLKMGDPQNPWVSTCFNTKMVYLGVPHFLRNLHLIRSLNQIRFFSSSPGPESRSPGVQPLALRSRPSASFRKRIVWACHTWWGARIGDAPPVGESPGVDRGTEDSYLERVFLVCKGAAGLNFENNNVQYVYIELYILSIHM